MDALQHKTSCVVQDFQGVVTHLVLKLDFDRRQAIHEASPTPLVIHLLFQVKEKETPFLLGQSLEIVEYFWEIKTFNSLKKLSKFVTMLVFFK